MGAAWRKRVYRFLLVAVLWALFVLHQYALLVQQMDPSLPTTTMIDAIDSFHRRRRQHYDHSSLQQLSGNNESSPAAANVMVTLQRARRGNVQNLVKEEHEKQKANMINMIDKNQTFADHTFNGIPVTYHADTTPASRIQCIHDDAADDADSSRTWMYRSCQYQNLCLDMETREYVLFVDNDGDSPSLPSVALGGINPRWTGRGFNMGVDKVKWEPSKRHPSDAATTGYYALPTDHVLIPFHSFAGHNVGHLMWDDFYPIFSLLRLFGLLDRQLVPLRHQIDQPLYANCDIRKNKRRDCAHNFARFWPLLGVNPVHFSTTKAAVLTILEAKEPKSRYVCASTAVTGFGFLTDHGWHDHGWNGQGHRPHNLARGPNFAAFGEFVVRHVLLGEGNSNNNHDKLPMPPPTGPVQVVLSTLSSRDEDRRLDFAVQLDYLRKQFDDNKISNSQQSTIQLHNYSLWQFSLEEQVRLARRTHIYVTACGGGVMTATFLPPGSVVIVYYNPSGGLVFAGNQQVRPTGGPARLDWDLLNNASHLRVHWLPMTTMNTRADLELLELLLRHEANTITLLGGYSY